jgi:tRNA pseudouridine38-40 synthase
VPPIIKFTVAYDGTRFLGWQLQPQEPTIQGELERALTALSRDGRRVVVHGAGRTDAGVHARAQVAHIQADLKVPADRLPYAVNTHLPPDIVVLESAVMPEGFHARFSATGKAYGYTIRLHRFPHPLTRHTSWRLDPTLDLDAMRAAAAQFVGAHDFTSLTTHAGDGPEDRVRRITRCTLELDPGGEYLHCTVEGEGFLRNMVRTLIGTLVEVGHGKRTPGSIPELLRARDRRLAGPTAPAGGLCLLRVDYTEIA